MSVRIAILGASGAVGSTLALHILSSGLLEPQDCLMLVGHGTSSIEPFMMAAIVVPLGCPGSMIQSVVQALGS